MENANKNVNNDVLPSGVMNKPNKKKNIRLIAIFSVAVLAIVSVVLLVIVTRLTVQDWLNRFERALQDVVQIKDENNPKLQDIVRRVEIIDDADIVQAEFEEQFIVSTDDNDRVVAYLYVAEKYPSLDENMSIVDEYYLDSGVMYTRRVNGEEIVSYSFKSSIDVIVSLANDKIGGAKYTFKENYFDPINGNDKIVSHTRDEHILSATVRLAERKDFLGIDMDIGAINDITLQMSLANSLELKQFQLGYMDNHNSFQLLIESRTPKLMVKPEWV